MERADLEWFLDHLELDIQDRRLQDGGYSLEFYWDTADVRGAVLGLDSFYDPAGQFDKQQFHDDSALIRCLAGAGWFGKIRLLQPHQAEFLKLIDADFGVPGQLLSSSRVKKLIEDSGLKHFPLDFESSSLEQMPDDRIADLVREQAGNAPTLFKIVYCAKSSWKSRLASWMRDKVLELDDDRFDYSTIVSSTEFHRLKDSLDEERPHSNVNNFADAIAICQLALKVRAYHRGEVRRVPRFFSSTPLYRRVLEKTGLQDLLQYSDSDRVVSVLCDQDYYKLKATFRPPDAQVKFGRVFADEFVTSLHDARDRVAAILKAQEPLTPELLARVTVGGRPLEDVIQSLRQYWFLENVWLPFGAAPQVIESVREYMESARQLRESSGFRESIEREIKATTNILKANSQEYKWISHLWTDLHIATERLHRLAKDFSTVNPDLFRTTGLLRFGFPPSQHGRIESLLQKLFGDRQAQDEVLIAIIQEFQAAKGRRHDDAPLVVSAAILWVLRMDEQLITLLGRGDQQLHYSLRIIAAAARFRNDSEISQGWQIIKGLERECERTNDTKVRFDLAVGLGYLYYHYWMRKLKSTPPLSESEGATLLATAVSYAKLAYLELGSSDLRKKVYALNQYLYYMLDQSDSLDWMEVNDTADRLLTFMDSNAVWQYRFDDTLATYYEKRAALSTSNAKKWLEQAEFFMERAWAHAGGDEEIAKHRAKLQIKVGALEN